MEPDERTIHETMHVFYRQKLADTEWALAQSLGREAAKDKAIAELAGAMGDTSATGADKLTDKQLVDVMAVLRTKGLGHIADLDSPLYFETAGAPDSLEPLCDMQDAIEAIATALGVISPGG